MKSNVYDKIVGSVKDLFGISSPAKEMEPLGAYVSEGFGIGITDAMAGVIKDINASLHDVLEAFDLGQNPLVVWADDVWSAINEKLTMAIDKIKELTELTSQGITLQTNMDNIGINRDTFRNNVISQDTEGADYLADALVSRLGPIIAQTRMSTPGDTSSDDLRPLYVGTLIADERGLRELEKKMRVITEAENERRGR